MKRFYSALLFLMLFAPTISLADLYLSVGGSYLFPQDKFQDYNSESYGFKIEAVNKNYCKLWYGLRLEHFALEAKDEFLPSFSAISSLSPVVKFAPFVNDCYDYKVIPYVQAMISLSSISGDDNLWKLGLGAAAGIGVAYNFKLFGKCWMLEFEGLYAAPNTILRDEGRRNLQSVNVGVQLGVAL